MESTGIWEFIYEGIEKKGFEVQLAHPLNVRAIAEARVKTGKVDARTLAQLPMPARGTSWRKRPRDPLSATNDANQSMPVRLLSIPWGRVFLF
jgi:transposase